MQYLKLTAKQRRIKHWRDQRNQIAARIMAADKRILRVDAFKQANQEMRSRKAELQAMDKSFAEHLRE